jgi:hypothetical protein
MAQHRRKYIMNEEKRTDVPRDEKSLSHLIGVLSDITARLNSAIISYSVMNDGLTGCGPEEANGDKGIAIVPNGQIYQVMEQAENIHNMLAGLDEQNRRLNTIIDR